MTHDLGAPLGRREALQRIAAGALGIGALGALGACKKPHAEILAGPTGESGHLAARPGAPTQAAEPGLVPLGLGPVRGEVRDGFLFVPSSYRPDVATPLVVLFHGAGGSATRVLPVLQAQAEARGFVVLAPDSRRQTWDLNYLAFDWDAKFLDLALAWAFDRVRVDPARVFASGFSDGASYALSLGATNGDLFRGLVAFSPGFYEPAKLRGKPSCFVSHGTEDPILNIDRCSRAIVNRLRGDGYDVTYQEFAGGHTVPEAIRVKAGEWIANSR
ncbi:MAG: alpha/beta hydrolase [Gemmatimonadaceae bacterium]